MGGRVQMGLLFYPRGGSAQVIRYLAAALGRAGWSIAFCAGRSASRATARHAETFFAGLDVQAVDYGPALEAFEAGRDPIAEPWPMHPSYEERPGVPDRVFGAVSA